MFRLNRLLELPKACNAASCMSASSIPTGLSLALAYLLSASPSLKFTPLLFLCRDFILVSIEDGS